MILDATTLTYSRLYGQRTKEERLHLQVSFVLMYISQDEILQVPSSAGGKFSTHCQWESER